MGLPIDAMTHEDWKKILIFIMRANELRMNMERDLAKARDEESDLSEHLMNPYAIEFREAADEIDDLLWLKFGIFVGRED